MSTEPLTLAHKALLDSRFKALALDISEYSFANLYLFRHIHEYALVQRDKEIFIQGKAYDGARYLMPTTDIRKLPQEQFIGLKECGEYLFPIPEEWNPFFESLGFASIALEAENDYVFSREKLNTYAGRHLDGRRSQVRQFLETYQVTESPITEQAITVLDTWQQHVTDPQEKTDYEPCLEAIKLHEELGLVGRLYSIEGKPAGFILGEPLNAHMFVMHFAKADLQYKGIYQYMYQSFAKSLDPRYTFVNWEQDLGKEGLRKSKSAYFPDKFIHKMRVKLC